MATDRLGDMALFAEAAALGSLSAAGRKLGLSPAAASARLLKLEASLHARLFERTTRQLRVTDEGRLYLQHCRIALQAIEDAEAALQAGQNQVRGKVRISTGGGVLPQWVASGRELFYVAADSNLMSVSLNVGNGSLEPSAPRALTFSTSFCARDSDSSSSGVSSVSPRRSVSPLRQRGLLQRTVEPRMCSSRSRRSTASRARSDGIARRNGRDRGGGPTGLRRRWLGLYP